MDEENQMVFNVLRIFNIIMYRDKDEFKSLTNENSAMNLKYCAEPFTRFAKYFDANRENEVIYFIL